MDDYIFKWIPVGVVLWSVTFSVVRRLLSFRSFEFCSRTVSILHATTAVALSVRSVQDWRCPFCPFAAPSSDLQMQALSVSMGYLIYDLILGLLDDRFVLDNVIHHLVSIVGLGAGLLYKTCGAEMVAALWITEISTPFLHFRELIKELGYRDGSLNLFADISFALIFSMARMVVGPYLTYVTWTHDNLLLIKLMALGLQLVSLFWFYKILRMVKYKMAKWTKSSKTA